MKKVLIGLLLFMCPFIMVNAECDMTKHQQYAAYAKNISLDNDYIASKKTYKITLYNVIKGLSVKYNGYLYHPDENNQVVFENIAQGKNVLLYIYGESGCTSQVHTISVNAPYFNIFYGSDICDGYEGKITQCTERFTSTEVTEKIVKQAIKNYENSIKPTPDPKDPEEISFAKIFKAIVDFGVHWGIKILLAVVTIILSITFFRSKLRKIEHGI